MSESVDGISFNLTRQNAGIVLNTALATALVAAGGAKAPAGTASADSTCPFGTATCASDSHAIGADDAASNASTVAAPNKAIKSAVLMPGV
jgi:hypothetical protein